jgi:hypothetical protein
MSAPAPNTPTFGSSITNDTAFYEQAIQAASAAAAATTPGPMAATTPGPRTPQDIINSTTGRQRGRGAGRVYKDGVRVYKDTFLGDPITDPEWGTTDEISITKAPSRPRTQDPKPRIPGPKTPDELDKLIASRKRGFRETGSVSCSSWQDLQPQIAAAVAADEAREQQRAAAAAVAEEEHAGFVPVRVPGLNPLVFPPTEWRKKEAGVIALPAPPTPELWQHFPAALSAAAPSTTNSRIVAALAAPSGLRSKAPPGSPAWLALIPNEDSD